MERLFKSYVWEWCKDIDFLLKTIWTNPNALRVVSSKIELDKDMYLDLIASAKNKGRLDLIKSVLAKFSNDADFILKSISICDRFSLNYASEELKHDHDFMLEAYKLIKDKSEIGWHYMDLRKLDIVFSKVELPIADIFGKMYRGEISDGEAGKKIRQILKETEDIIKSPEITERIDRYLVEQKIWLQEQRKADLEKSKTIREKKEAETSEMKKAREHLYDTVERLFGGDAE